jgi:predicted DNA-binding protein
MSDAEFEAFLHPPTRVEDMTAEELGDFLERLEPVPTTPEQQAMLEASLPPADPDAPMNVVRSLRLPEELNRRLDEAAAAEHIPASTFIRRAIESALAGRIKENLVSVDDVIRAIRSVPPAAA